MSEQFPQEMGGVPVCGYLVGVHVPEGTIDLGLYTRKLDALVQEGKLEKDVVDRGLRVRSRQPGSAFAAACTRFMQTSPQGHTRFLLRRNGFFGTGKAPSNARFLVEEQMDKDARKPHYRVLALVAYDLQNVASLVWTTFDAFDPVLKTQLEVMYTRELQGFSGRLLHARISNVLRHRLPIVYGPGRSWCFLPASERRMLLGIEELIKPLGGKLNILPLPDVEGMDEFVRQGLLDDLQQTLAVTEAAFQQYEDDKKSQAGMLARLSTAIRKLDRYVSLADRRVGELKDRLKDARQKACKIVGLDVMDDKPKRNRWGSRASPQAKEFAERFCGMVRDACFFLREGEVAVYQKGFGAEAKPIFVQDCLDDRVLVTLHFYYEPNSELKELGAEETNVGWTIEFLPNARMYTALAEWWKGVDVEEEFDEQECSGETVVSGGSEGLLREGV